VRARRASRTDDAKLLDAIRRDQESLEQLASDFYGEALIGRAEFFAARTTIADRLDANQRRLASVSGSSVLESLQSSDELLREAWAKADIERRRSILRAVVAKIVLKPVGKGVHHFDPGSVEILWLT
jgi:hypothetical protein